MAETKPLKVELLPDPTKLIAALRIVARKFGECADELEQLQASGEPATVNVPDWPRDDKPEES